MTEVENNRESKPRTEENLIFEDSNYIVRTLLNLNKLRKNKQFCDVVLQIETAQDVREIHAHRAVLASASPYLFELFAADHNGGHVYQFKSNGSFDFDSFEVLVEYAYTARLVVSADKVKQAYVAATKLRMTSAAGQCRSFLIKHLTAENCIDVRSIPGLSPDTDPEFIAAVDNYIRQNIGNIIQKKVFLSLPHIQIEQLQNSCEEMQATNQRHLCEMVLDWIKKCFDEHDINAVTEKVHMLYLNPDGTLHDCNDIKNGDSQDSDLIQDYKKLSRRIPVPCKTNKKSSPQSTSHKPRQFLYTRSNSTSSLSSLSDDEERDWRVVATTAAGKNTILALIVVCGKLRVLSVKQRLNTPSSSPAVSRPESVEKANTYTLIPPMTSGRCAVGTADLQGKLLVCGGYDRGECLRTVEIYDRSTNKWSRIESMRVPRGRFGITVVNNEVYAVGGSDGTRELNSVEVFSPMTSCWKQFPPMSIHRSYAGVCYLDGKIFVIGGWNGQRGLTHCEVYDTKSYSWTNIADLSIGRYQAGVGVMNGEVYAVGGCDSWNCIGSVEKYDPHTNTWSTVSSMHKARRGCGVAVYNGKLYAVGGHDGVRSLSSVEVYDPQTNSWSSGPNLTSCRANVGVCVVGDYLYAVGGFNGKTFLNTIEFLDGRTNEFTTFVPREVVTSVNEQNDLCRSRQGISMVKEDEKS
ncbi:influenza virus NS1A-binding protein homolog [Tachypleus tridentatus]|uniref:influenza virus NS1A-binding protein homolog n=1 Tax=Tachypleus tridentatus TaxID=6853 RepID=UPI003FD20962